MWKGRSHQYPSSLCKLRNIWKNNLEYMSLSEYMSLAERTAFNYRGSFPGCDSVGSCDFCFLPTRGKKFQSFSKGGGKRERRLNLSLNRAQVSSSSPENSVWTGKQREKWVQLRKGARHILGEGFLWPPQNSNMWRSWLHNPRRVEKWRNDLDQGSLTPLAVDQNWSMAC